MKTTIHFFHPARTVNAVSTLIRSVAKIFRASGLGAMLLCTGNLCVHAALPVGGSPDGFRTLVGHVPSIVRGLQAQGNVPANQVLHLAIGLPLRNTNELAQLLEQVYDPASTNYHRYLTPAEFTERFGPTEQDYQMVENFARVNGLTVTAEYPNRLLLDVSGRAVDVERAFHVLLRTYQHPTENRVFFAPDTEPSISAGLPILDVSGLDNLRQPHPLYKLSPVKPASIAKPAAAPSPNATTGSGPSGTYMGDDFRRAYVPGSPLNGAGQTIAQVQFDGFYSNDIAAYAAMAGRTNIPVQTVLIDGFSGVPTGNGGEVEVSLDIEMAMSMAPALTRIIEYEGNPLNFHPNDVLNRIATDNAAKQISCSWGWTGGPNATTDQIFQQMALQGQTFFTASGDSDAYPAGTVDNPFNLGTPADNPYITSVGGTTLTMNGAGASYASETVWNWGIRYGDDGVGSSGGFSSYYPIPAWQTNINLVVRGGSQTTRNFPDVALTADDVFVIADGGVQYLGVGGTSCAAPLWAGFAALINQQAALNNRPPIGFLNPALYAIANSSAYTNCFHDTVTGNNTWSGSPNLFYATNNYDLCTGLGTPNGTNLINALTVVGLTNPITHLSPPPPPYGSTLSALNGGNPNGTWQLFVLDDAPFNGGAISNGWTLTLVTANPVGYSADVALGMSASAPAVVIGSTVTYTLTVTNYGPSVSSNVVVADTLPLGAVYVSAVSDQGTLTRNGQMVNWVLPTLVPGTGAQMTLTAQLNSYGNLLNSAQVTAGTSDANSDNNFALATVNVINPTPPQFSNLLARTNGFFQLSVASPALPTVIQASTNLVDWVTIYTNTPPFTFTDSNAVNFPIRFYRALTP
ncbi:MAG TPA: protease pro-enzyme activation domain-containing protein [Verrucomicrobiae bacterium]|nr:protease pro-enzyme activation domain-containing protein [Verrucomicrobiae bacterium]